MKTSKYPRFRSLTKRGRNGQIWVYYSYDMRGTGKSDAQLGSDYAVALQKWEKLHNHIPMTIGKLQQAIDKWREECLPEYPVAKTRSDYTRQLKRIEAVFGECGWHQISLPLLCTFLTERSAKTQANRELAVLSIVWNKARLWGMTDLPWPAVGMKGWKNKEQAREFEVTDALFAALYEQADEVLRDCLDIATATGMRLTDVRTVRMPVDGQLRFKAGKTGKWAYFDVAQSPVLSAVIERRGKRNSVMLLCTSTGKQVSASMLRSRYDKAREEAALANPFLANDLRAMILRDSRKRAADLADDLEGASKLLQHSSTKLTSTHYRTKATKLTAVR